MPDRPSYNTRLRTNSVLLPPRRLRHSPTPPPRPSRPPRPRLPITTAPPPFPPPNVVLHPDDANNKTFIAIGRALLAIDNRAITIKDLSQLSLDCGLLCQNVSAASQAITTFIRNHMNRCSEQRTQPLLLSLALTGTADDDRLAPALHSRSGGTSTPKEQDPSLTCFRRGTTVWYLSELAGAPCPFKRAGLSIDGILPAPHGEKRKRCSPNVRPRKLPACGPAMATRTRTRAHSDGARAPAARLRLKLTLRVPNPEPSSDSDSDSSESVLSSPISPSNSASDSPFDSRPHSPAPCNPLPPYPILSPSIPSPSCITPATTLASPSAPCASFLPVYTALSNPPRDYRSRSRSLPFSSASPPPDSEDEDNDFHNSMVGLRRGSVPLLKKEEDDHSNWDRPLELLPGFVSFNPSPVKSEPTSAVMPPTPDEWNDSIQLEDRWSSNDRARYSDVKPEHSSDDERTVLNPDDDTPSSVGKGTRDDPVCIDSAVGDVEILGPESVRSRELDAAWSSAKEPVKEAIMEIDTECEREADSREPEMDAPSPESIDTVPTAVSSPPPLEGWVPVHDAPFVMYPLRPCDPPIIATVIEGIPVYHTFLAPDISILRRVDTGFVTLAPLLAAQGLSQNAVAAWVPLTVAQAVAPPRLAVFLSPDLDTLFPAPLARVHEAGIRAEDVIDGGGGGGAEERAEVEGGAGATGAPQVLRREPRETPLTALPSVVAAEVVIPGPPAVLDDLEDEALFRLFVDFAEVAPVRTSPACAKENVGGLKEKEGVGQTAAAKEKQKEKEEEKENAHTNETQTEKENINNATGTAPSRRKLREKSVATVAAADVPMRRSKRTAVVGPGATKQAGAPLTRARSRANSRLDGRANA